MLSSISNSKTQNWGKSWTVALLIALLLLGGLEAFWRVNGHQPAIVDDQRLWAIERSRIGKSDKEIVLLGSSRMQTDISTSTLRRLAPNHSIINLSADGTCANTVLRDLAGEDSFKGTAIVETTSECIMFGDDLGLSQQFYVDYFYRTYNLNISINRRIATFMQRHLTVIDPYLNLIKVAGDLVVKGKWRTPNYLSTYEDRSRAADYSKTDIERHKTMRLHKVDVHYRTLSERISTDLLKRQTNILEQAVTAIEKRGGSVIFVRFPVSDEHWEIDERYFPRLKYWDPITTITSAKVIHFRDIGGMKDLQCPDTSHLDRRDTRPFTESLVAELIDTKEIKR